jgi:predicted RNA-binding Zn ribbon-like protein
MPEHRDQTPGSLRDLESFLWHDFAWHDAKAGKTEWSAWLSRKMPDQPARGQFENASVLHAALRALQAVNNGIAVANTSQAHDAINALIVHLGIRPRLGPDGELHLAPVRKDSVSQLLLVALDLMQNGQWRRFKLCRDPACRASYYDASKPAGKIWCAMETCGSRDKMRRYRSRA